MIAHGHARGPTKVRKATAATRAAHLGAATLAMALAMSACGGGASGPIGGSGGATGSGGSDAGVVATGSGGGVGSGGAGSGGSGSGGAGVDTGVDVATEVPAASCPGAGKALHFEDDVGGKASISMQVLADLGADLPIGNAARTIEMWLYFEGNESWKAEHSLVEYGGVGRCQAFGIDGGDNALRDPVQFDPFTFSAGGPCKGDDNNTIMPAPPRTGWLHLAWVYDPAGQLAYSGMTNLNFLFTVNGMPQNIPDKIQTGMLLSLPTPVSIGSGQDSNNGYTGKIDEFRMWNVARTPQEIADNYRLILRGDEPGLVAYYHFDDATGTTPKDSSSKHHDARFAAGHPAPTWVDSTDLVLTCK